LATVVVFPTPPLPEVITMTSLIVTISSLKKFPFFWYSPVW
jgi:hypothetical protein